MTIDTHAQGQASAGAVRDDLDVKEMSAQPPRPLAGVRVLDLARLIPGGLVTRWLADLGAEVLKVEEQGRGDYLRWMPPYVDGLGLMQVLCDRGKASLELDFGSEEGKARLRQLAEVADVIVEGSRPGATTRIGLDLGALRRQRPELVVCSVTGFGLNGTLAAVPAHGMTIDTLAGVADTHQRDGRWMLAGALASTLGVEFGALNAVIGIMASLMNVRLGGEGSWLDVSLWDAAVEANRLNVALALSGADERLVIGDQGPLYSVYECADQRLVMFGAVEEKFWVRFCRAVGRDDLIPRWGSRGEIGFGDDSTLGDELVRIFAERSSGEWAELFRQEDVPGNIVLTVDDVVAHRHFSERRLVETKGESGRIPNILNPIVWADCAGKRLGDDLPRAPKLGERGAVLASRWLENRSQLRN